ncbi:MAG: sulfite exporter TauE/SafE family protein [Candidatus Micrarchaeia archaeon]
MLFLCEMLVLFATALFVGIIGNLVGIGGGVLIMVILLFGFKMQPVVAGGLSLLTILASASVGTLSNIRQKALSRTLFALISVFAGIGVLVGSVIPYYLNTKSFETLFGFVSIGIGLFSIYATQRDIKNLAGISKSFSSLSEAEREHAKENIRGKPKIGIYSFVAGLVAGIFGIGIGGIVGTYLTAIKKIQPKVAFSTVLAAMIVTSVLGSYAHLFSIKNGAAMLGIILSLAIGVGIGALVGSHLSMLVKSSKLRFAQGYIILGLGIIAVIFSFIM